MHLFMPIFFKEKNSCENRPWLDSYGQKSVKIVVGSGSVIGSGIVVGSAAVELMGSVSQMVYGSVVVVSSGSFVGSSVVVGSGSAVVHSGSGAGSSVVISGSEKRQKEPNYFLCLDETVLLSSAHTHVSRRLMERPKKLLNQSTRYSRHIRDIVLCPE